jgi:hypothetical protein
MIKKNCFILFLLTCHFVMAGEKTGKDTAWINNLLIQSVHMQSVNTDSCFKLAEEAYQLARETNYQEGICGALILFGSVFMIKGYNDSALTFIKHAVFNSQ